MTTCWIVIPTFNRCDLLERTLLSLSNAKLPRCVKQIIVAENGQKAGSEELLRGIAEKIPVQYRFTTKPNKSHALNEILKEAGEEFIIFFDDDVRLDAEILVAYTRALVENRDGVFLAGRCLVDYEEAPPPWLNGYLPPSVNGWELGDVKVQLTKPDALGANWGAFAADLKSVGGFDEGRGPGTKARGQESSMQQKLLDKGLTGYYLPDAVLWHFVPRDRCSPEWALERCYQMSVGRGMNMGQASRLDRVVRAATSRFKLHAIRMMMAMFGSWMDESRRFHYQYRIRDHTGMLHGLAESKRRRAVWSAKKVVSS